MKLLSNTLTDLSSWGVKLSLNTVGSDEIHQPKQKTSSQQLKANIINENRRASRPRKNEQIIKKIKSPTPAALLTVILCLVTQYRQKFHSLGLAIDSLVIFRWYFPYSPYVKMGDFVLFHFLHREKVRRNMPFHSNLHVDHV